MSVSSLPSLNFFSLSLSLLSLSPSIVDANPCGRRKTAVLFASN